MIFFQFRPRIFFRSSSSSIPLVPTAPSPEWNWDVVDTPADEELGKDAPRPSLFPVKQNNQRKRAFVQHKFHSTGVDASGKGHRKRTRERMKGKGTVPEQA